MFEKFPQLWRLERMLSKAQTEDSTPGSSTNLEIISPRLKKNRDFFRWKVKHDDAFDDISEAFEQQARIQHRALNLYDSDDLTGFEKPSLERAKENSKPIKSHSRAADAKGMSPRNHHKKVISKGPQTEYAMKLYNLGAEEKRALLRAMENTKPSDSLNVLSDEENDECPVECQRACRYPLPTMPLAIMVPHPRMPVEIFPLDSTAVTEKVAEYDGSIEELMQVRNRLSSCFELFDDLCTSFCGPQNLDCFLRSMISCNSFRSSKKDRNLRSEVFIRSEPVIKPAKGELFASVPPEKPSKNEDSNFGGSRLLRPTISTQMKHIDVRNKESASDVVDLSSKVSVTLKRNGETASQMADASVQPCGKKSSRRRSTRPAAVPPSEEDAHEDMLLRVRRHLMRMPWMGRSKRNSRNKLAVF